MDTDIKYSNRPGLGSRDEHDDHLGGLFLVVPRGSLVDLVCGWLGWERHVIVHPQVAMGDSWAKKAVSERSKRGPCV